jgi:hypothetical protein
LSKLFSIYEKASGSTVNYEKTKGMYIGSAKNNRPKFTKIVWTKDNVKTLGIHHGYNILSTPKQQTFLFI